MSSLTSSDLPVYKLGTYHALRCFTWRSLDTFACCGWWALRVPGTLSTGEWVFLYPPRQFNSPGGFLYRPVALVVITFPDRSVCVLVRCWAASVQEAGEASKSCLPGLSLLRGKAKQDWLGKAGKKCWVGPQREAMNWVKMSLLRLGCLWASDALSLQNYPVTFSVISETFLSGGFL